MALFSKSAAKLLQQTAKTCQYLKKNAKKVHFFQGMVRYVNFFRKVVNLFREAILINSIFCGRGVESEFCRSSLGRLSVF